LEANKVSIRVLGCSGGIGGNSRTTSFLVDDDVLIDAGTGVGDLSLAALLKIEHVFVTHSHLDHITSIPFLCDTIMGLRAAAVTVYALPEVIAILKEHIFNWLVWPNFNQIPDVNNPLLRYHELKIGDIFTLNHKAITVLPANHVVPAVGYQISNGNESMVFTGDTTFCQPFWQTVNQINNLKMLIIETAFANSDAEMAALSKHYCPQTLALGLAQLKQKLPTYITHLKPGEDAMIMQEIAANPATAHCLALQQNQIFSLGD
jgi:ribonuclease BN (tRNA processing enzyme)